MKTIKFHTVQFSTFYRRRLSKLIKIEHVSWNTWQGGKSMFQTFSVESGKVKSQGR